MIEHINLYDDSGCGRRQPDIRTVQKKILRDDNGAKTILLKLPENFHFRSLGIIK